MVFNLCLDLYFRNDELENLDTVNEKLRRHVSLDNGDYRMHYI